MSNCYSCQRCVSGTYSVEGNVIDEGNLICLLTGNVLVDCDGNDINVTPCSNYKEHVSLIERDNLILEPLPF